MVRKYRWHIHDFNSEIMEKNGEYIIFLDFLVNDINEIYLMKKETIIIPFQEEFTRV